MSFEDSPYNRCNGMKCKYASQCQSKYCSSGLCSSYAIIGPGLSVGTIIVIILGSLAVLGAIGYFIYKKIQEKNNMQEPLNQGS